MIEPTLIYPTVAIAFGSMIAHEVAHAATALDEGDPTAYEAGRITANPLAHVDLVFTVILPLITFWIVGVPVGGLKPVPVNRMRYKDGLASHFRVSIAGIVANLALAGFAFLVLQLWLPPEAETMFTLLFRVNLSLAVFNLIPVPPLDGWQLFRGARRWIAGRRAARG